MVRRKTQEPLESSTIFEPVVTSEVWGLGGSFGLVVLLPLLLFFNDIHLITVGVFEMGHSTGPYHPHQTSEWTPVTKKFLTQYICH
jgi:hypothetical protein